MRYAELTVHAVHLGAPRGMPAEAFSEAIEDARGRGRAPSSGCVLRWCFDIPGESGVPAADVTLDIALDQRPDGLVGFGLGGPELGVPRSRFQPHFARARAAGLHSVPHAGESTGPETVWDSLDLLGAERIGHGIASAQRPGAGARTWPRRHAARGVPDVQRRAPGRCRASPSTRCRRWSRPA